MIPRFIFALVVRALGLATLVRGLEALPLAGARFCEAVARADGMALLGSVALGAAPLVAGAWLIQGAPFRGRRVEWGVGMLFR